MDMTPPCWHCERGQGDCESGQTCGQQAGAHTHWGMGTIMGRPAHLLGQCGNVYGQDNNVGNPLQFTMNLVASNELLWRSEELHKAYERY